MALVLSLFSLAANGMAQDAGTAYTDMVTTIIAPQPAMSEGRSDPEDSLELDEGEVDESDDDPMIYQIVQELFLGVTVYPQEKGEWQFTTGYFQGTEVHHDGFIPLEVEYGITGRFQVGVGVPHNLFSSEEDYVEGVEYVGVELYYNFYNNPQSQTALGLGYEFGIPVRTLEDEPRTYLHEPFFIAYQQFGATAVNFSAGLEIANSSEETGIASEMALGVFREFGAFVPMIELGVEIDEQGVPLVLSTGLFWKPRKGCEIGASLPIGLNDDAPDIGAAVLLILELGGDGN